MSRSSSKATLVPFRIGAVQDSRQEVSLRVSTCRSSEMTTARAFSAIGSNDRLSVASLVLLAIKL